MDLPVILTKGLNVVKSNSPEILTALGVSGVLTTSYLVAKATYTACIIINQKEYAEGVHDDPKERLKERTQLVWRHYIPAGVSGALTIGCIVGASKANSRRATAAVTAYSITERAFSEYREKVVEQIGKNKEQKIRDNIAQDHVAQNPAPSREVIILGKGHVLCCELFTNRYFKSDMELLRRAQNDINAKIINSFYVTLDEFYDLIDLPHTSTSGNLGWDSDKMLELQFSAVISGDGEPCLAFDYNYTKPLK